MNQTNGTSTEAGNHHRLGPRTQFSWPGGSLRRTVALVALVACTAFVIVRPSVASAAESARTATDGPHTVVPVRYPPAEGALGRNVTTAPSGLGTTVVTIKLRDADGSVGTSELIRGRQQNVDDIARRFPGALVAPLFIAPTADLVADRSATAVAAAPLSDLTSYLRVEASDTAQADRLVAAASNIPNVESAQLAPQPAPLPATPNFEGSQRYRNPAPTGVGVTADARGEGVRIIDIEYSWNPDHEDLGSARGNLIPNGTPVDPFSDTNHGTAVLGELIGADNGIGVRGLVPDAEPSMVNATNVERGWDLANAINIAHRRLRAGDVLLIEQQTFGPACQSCYLPPEWIPPVFDAIAAATADGVLVVETAGNGGQDLDAPMYGGAFDRGRRDSGAFMVGAGDACSSETPRGRAIFSNYGSRLDFQGWGGCVTTTGYSDLFGFINTAYTGSFSGTSSAAPIVAGSIAAVSGSYRAQFGHPPTPAVVREILNATATPQQLVGALSGNIGPQPNIALALAAIDGMSKPKSIAIGDVRVMERTAGMNTVKVPVTLSSPSTSRVSVQYRLRAATAKSPSDFDARDGALQTLSLALSPTTGHTTTTAYISVGIHGDSVIEANEQFIVELVSASNDYAVTRSRGTVAIINDDPARNGLGMGDVQVTEGSAETRVVRVPITLSTAATQRVTVRYRLRDGTAISPSDFDAFGGATKTLVFAPSSTTGRTATIAYIAIPIRGDTAAESNERFGIQIVSAIGAPVSRVAGTVTILDDD